MEWTQTRDDVQYNVSTEPPVDVNFIGNLSVQMVVFYNTFYSVHMNIMANGLCNATVGFNYSEFYLYLINLKLVIVLIFISCSQMWLSTPRR